ncbi:MAG: glycosyl hydrolase, partial [Deltaproteobacteria bacterium]|nr:glycosyl hydrolase [Deltaproteobacteria bacterium]
MSPTGLFALLKEMVMKAIGSLTRIGLRTSFTLVVVLLVLFGCHNSSLDGGRGENVLTEYPSVDDSFLSALEWRFVGPYRGGRVVAVAGHPDDPLIYYFGAAHSGVWKTTDAGRHWRNVSDGFFKFPALGALDVSLSDPKVIFAGTGEGLPRQFISPGDGVYKSTDGGETWTNVGLRETRHIARLRIHPTNPDIVYVAAMGDMFGPNTDRGLYRTSDGGKTWERILYKDETTGAVDLSIDFKNPKVIIAALNHHVTYPWDEESSGPSTGLFKSTDGGDTWTDITHNPGMPKGLVGKIGISISPADSNRVYAFIEADRGEGGIYRSHDGGSTWQLTHQDPGKMEIPNSYNHITADPQDPDVVYIQPITGLHKSTDTGRTFKRVPMENWDPHALWIAPNDSRRMIEGGDGGASVTLNGGESWSSLKNQPTADLLSLAVDDQEPYWLYGAQNDNSHIAIPSRTDAQTIGWNHYLIIPAGEGGQTAVKPDGSVVYACDRSRMVRFDRENGQAPHISVWPEWVFGTPVKDVKYRFYYSFPVLLSPHDPGLLYTAAQYVFRSKDEGQSWEQISPDLTRNRQDVMGEISGGPISSNASSLFHVSLIRTLAESPLKKGELWVGTDDSTIQVSTDGGSSWQDVSPPDLLEWTTITAIDVSPHRPGTVYISGERHRVSDRTPYLYKTTDYGNTWQRITNGIRENDYSWVIREDPVRPGLLYAGTETGVYVSFNAGESWLSLQRNLPPVIVMQMVVKDNDLVVATHGRGFWIMDNISSLRQITPEVVLAPVHLFKIVPALRQPWGGGGYSGSPEEARNPPRGVMIEYYLAEARSSEVTLTLMEADGDIIQQFYSRSPEGPKPPTRAGMNRFFWDMRYPRAQMPPAAGALKGFLSIDYSAPSPPVAPPGQYIARLTVNGQTYQQPFKIQKNSRAKASDADLRAQFDLMIDIRDRFREVADTVMRIREIRAQVEGRRAELPEESRVEADRILKQLREIEGILTIWMGSEAHPMMWSPPGLTEKLSSLSHAVGAA